ncbi:MAG: ATP synthase subunit a [Dehalococcoidia bacterium]|nr:ATP synthase subunit a [Bacillota bacterium]MBT9142733.1 ATP synthase subunit a [Bacillota bacterium]
MNINPDELIIYQLGWFQINATILVTWIIMAFLVIGSWLVTRRLTSEGPLTRGQNLLEVLVTMITEQIEEVSRQTPGPYLPFIGTLFIFIAVANLLSVVPGYIPPTSSLSTTTALAISVFIAVPVFGITRHSLKHYAKQYLQPTFFMLPFNIIGEISRTLALAVRLYGNIMSGTIIVAILLTITPLFFPVIMQVLGLLTGLIQAYIFAILAMVYIASASKAHQKIEDKGE